jgi:hypothetical protein
MLEELKSVKRILLITVWTFFLSGFCGCKPGQETVSPDTDSHKPQEPGYSFPDFIAGTWKSDKAGWMISFEPNGSISSMRHFLGVDIDISEGGVREEWTNGVVAVYFLGPCEAVYTPKTRQLDVTITIEHFYVDFSTYRMDGSCVDYLKGPISQDGKQWKVSWLNYGKIEGAKEPDPNKIQPKFITFTKIRDDNQ